MIMADEWEEVTNEWEEVTNEWEEVKPTQIATKKPEVSEWEEVSPRGVKDEVEGWWKRKVSLYAKTVGDIIFAPIGGAKGALEKDIFGFKSDILSKPLQYKSFTGETLTTEPIIKPEKIKEAKEIFSTIKPKTPTEHTISAIAQWTTFGKVLRPLNAIFGLGKTGIGVGSKMARGAAIGGILGAAPEGTPQERLTRGTIGAGLFGVATGATAIVQNRLAQYSNKRLQQVLTKATKVADEVEKGLKGFTGVSKAKYYNEIIKRLNPKEQLVVRNMLRGRYSMPQKEWRNLYQRKIGDPLYSKFISKLEKYTPNWMKEALVYRHNSPEFLTEMYEQRQTNLTRWSELAERSGNLMTEGVSGAESKLMLRALRVPDQLEILKRIKPDLASRVIQTRNAIDETSRQVSEQLMRKANITDRVLLRKKSLSMANTINDNIGEYVKRVYEAPTERISRRFFIGRKAIKEPRIFERGKVARQIYENNLNKKINESTKEFTKLRNIGNIKGIGAVAQGKLKSRNITTVENLLRMNDDDLARVLSPTRKKLNVQQLNRLRTQAQGIRLEAEKIASRRRGLTGKINEYNNLIRKPLKKPDIPFNVQKRLGVIETGGYPVARSIKDAGYKIEGARFFNDIATNSKLATNSPQDALARGWKQIADTEANGVLRGMYVHPAVAKDVTAIQRILQEEDRIYNQFLSLWKSGKVTMNPATHGRNIISNTILLESSGVPSHRIPDLLSASIDDIARNTQMYKDLKKLGLGYGTFTKVEIESLSQVYTGQKGLAGRLAKAKDVLKPFKSLQRLYEFEEEVFKIARARYMLEQGWTLPNAFKEGQKWLFNYNQIPEFIRRLRQAPLGAPFVTFQYKMLPRVTEALFKNPQKIVKYPLLFKALEKYAIKKYNLSDSDVQIIKRNQPLTYILPFTDNNGQLRLYNLQYTLPYGQVFEIGDRGFQAMGFGGNPLFSVPYNLFVSNRDPYTGKDIIDRNSNLWRKFKDSMSFTANQALPPLTPYLGYSAKQIGKAMKGIPLSKYGEKPDYVLEMLGNVAGLKTKPVTVDTATWRLSKYISFLKLDSQRKAGATLNDQTLTEKQRLDRWKEIYTDMINNIDKATKSFRKK